MNTVTDTSAAAPATAEPTILHTVEHISLSRLVPSKANARRMNATAGIAELADSIEAHGLIHNLTVRKAKKGKFEVVAGSRRLAALTLLAHEGRLAAEIDIPCNVLGAEDDAEISLAENVQREAMHVVDEILAFRDLVERGTTPETIAARFGQSVTTVRQRLKLAHLSPKVMDVLREDGMSLEQARALALSDSHDEQERAWFESPAWNRDPHSLRSLLTRDHVRSTNRLAIFVGLPTYEAAGGIILRDLFADNAATFLTDPSLLNQLALTALEHVAETAKAEGWKWAEASLDGGALHRSGFGRVYAEARAFTEDEEARLAQLGNSYDTLVAEIDDLPDGDELHAAELRLAEVEREIETLQTSVKAYTPEAMAHAGCIITVDQNGVAQINRGYVAPGDVAALERSRTAGDEGDDAAGSPAPLEDEPNATYSAALVEELTAIRTAAMRVELANRPSVALAALLHPLVAAQYYSGSASYGSSYAVEIRAQNKDLAPALKEPANVRAFTDWNALRDSWGDHLPGDPADLWAWLLAQPVERLLDLLAIVTAATLNGVIAKHDHGRDRLANAERIADAVELDMRTYWTPDAMFLSRLSKAGICAVLTEAGLGESVRAIEKAPKASAVIEAQSLLLGTDWLPTLLQTAASASETDV